MKGLNKDILKLALPSILANITIPILGMVDIAIAGHLDVKNGESAILIGGITIGSMIFDLIYFSVGFLRAGTGGLTAQAYGRNDFQAAADTFSRSICIALASSFFLLAIQWIVVQLVFLFVECTPATQELASTYFYIRIWAAPAAISLMAFKGWFIGMQDTVSSMMSDLTVVFTNMIASALLAFGIGSWDGIGFKGIPAGTVIAQYTGLALAITVLWKKYRPMVFHHYTIRKALNVYYSPGTRVFFQTNGDLFIRSACFAGIYMGFTTLSAKYGDMALASSAIIMKLMLFFSYFTDGFAYAGEALTGKFFGAGLPAMVRQTIRKTFIWSMSIALLFVIINGVFAIPLFKMMTSDLAIVEFSKHFIIWMLLVPIFGCPAFVWDGIYIGATCTHEMRNSSIWSVVGFYLIWFGIGSIYGVVQETGTIHELEALHILLLSYTMHLIVRTIYQSIIYSKKKGTFAFLK